MAAIDEAVSVLATAESSLRGLVARAAGEGDYDAVIHIAAWAKRVGELLADSSGADPGRADEPQASPVARSVRQSGATEQHGAETDAGVRASEVDFMATAQVKPGGP